MSCPSEINDRLYLDWSRFWDASTSRDSWMAKMVVYDEWAWVLLVAREVKAKYLAFEKKYLVSIGFEKHRSVRRLILLDGDHNSLIEAQIAAESFLRGFCTCSVDALRDAAAHPGDSNDLH